MNKTTLLFLMTTQIWASESVITESCKQSVIDQAITMEKAYILTQGDTQSQNFETRGYFHKVRKDDQNYSFSIFLNDTATGRQGYYHGKFSEAERHSCEIKPVRYDEYSCRFSSDYGVEGLGEIKGAMVSEFTDYPFDASFTKLQEERIRALLKYGIPTLSLSELILEQTDDQEVFMASVTFANGEVVEYIGAYGGDNQFGAFFRPGSAQIVGENSDGSVCINF